MQKDTKNININYSIIIPHKNSQDLLVYCLSTIPVRDDVQVIVVDDNSDPQKVDFAHFPQWKGIHYEYYWTKEGKGAGYARNVGLEHAKGEWILFIDADDFVLPIINDIFDDYVNVDADLIYFRPTAVMMADRMSPSKRADWYNHLIDGYFQNRSENDIRCRFFSPTCKLIKRFLMETYNIRFEEIPYSNDAVCSVMIGCVANKIEVVDRTYYVITESPNSLTSNLFSKPNELEIRTEAFFKTQSIIYKFGRRTDEGNIILYLRRLFSSSRNNFFYYFKLAQSFGYSRKELICKLFNENKWQSRVKRSIYVWFKTI